MQFILSFLNITTNSNTFRLFRFRRGHFPSLKGGSQSEIPLNADSVWCLVNPESRILFLSCNIYYIMAFDIKQKYYQLAELKRQRESLFVLGEEISLLLSKGLRFVDNLFTNHKRVYAIDIY
jgi:hypothetical protein